VLAAWLKPAAKYQVHDFEEVDWIPPAQIPALLRLILGFLVAWCRLLIEINLPLAFHTAIKQHLWKENPLQIAPRNSACPKTSRTERSIYTTWGLNPVSQWVT